MLRDKLQAEHEADPSKPSLKQLYWLEAYFEKPAASKGKKKGLAADPTSASLAPKRGAARSNAGENVNFKCLVDLKLRPMDGWELSDL